jgi:hypothetical protein
MTEEELRKAIYDQDCQSLRHQDNLTWGRFLTASTIEAGMLYGLYQVHTISTLERLLLAVFGGALVFIVSLLSLKDYVDARGHLNRAKKFEKEIAPFEAVLWRWPIGGTLLKVAVCIITIGNIGLIFKFTCIFFAK